jgi:hypothetical protein
VGVTASTTVTTTAVGMNFLSDLLDSSRIFDLTWR